MPKKTLTQGFVDSATPERGKNKSDYFDTKVNGLLLKVLQTGKRTFYIRYKNERNKLIEKRLTAVDASALSLNNARELAQQKLAQIALGKDPFAKAELLRDIPTFREFVEQSYMPHVKGYKRSWGTDLSLLKNHILPAIGGLYMDQVSRRHMIELFAKHRQSHKPGSTNRIIILTRYIFNCAIKWEVPLEKNPTSGIELYPENNKLERYLSEDEAKRLFEALGSSRSKMLKYIVSMLLLTGARKSEVLRAKWSDFDIEGRRWKIEFNKSGKTRYVPLSDGVIRLLDQVPTFDNCEWVFPNVETLKPYKHIFYSWDVARKRAGLGDLRIHDLRHSFASFLVNGGRSLYEVQKLLGHTQIKTTQRYAHLSQDSLLSAASVAISHVPMAQAMPDAANDLPLIQAKTKTAC
ncbi:integrase [Thiosulfatimonas sediminis]|uniref:Integrase n=1 Tax=Thiosulfatimonas sediminis TaxID=2675054 RepID=A0A6F8PSL7_9GAMM|nr:site-specific integrase [Thiosulfatimonas sediminis]BBP45123.1 integrase [Thiosulfatimonas sediminis]